MIESGEWWTLSLRSVAPGAAPGALSRGLVRLCQLWGCPISSGQSHANGSPDEERMDSQGALEHFVLLLVPLCCCSMSAVWK